MRYVGFSVGGLDWLWTDLVTAASPQERSERLRLIGLHEARLTHQLGGNLLRVFIDFASLLGQRAGNNSPFATHIGPWYQLLESDKVGALDGVWATLNEVLDAMLLLPANGEGLAFGDLDAYLAGVRAFNATQLEPRSVQVLLTLVAPPPVPILESPSRARLAHFKRSFTFETLWARYLDTFRRLWRMVVRRYVEPGDGGVVCALEINNEPDYEWLPDEFRIEKAHDRTANPLRKYITELHHPQIPETAAYSAPFERGVWGGFQDQEGPWTDYESLKKARVSEFQWGQKFDWYVRCYAEFAEQTSYAILDETRAAGCADVAVISAGVTHNNIDFLTRMYRANPNAFTYCTAIGLHPYHWPQHNIYDRHFRSPYDLSDWRSATPREFAFNYFKRFDFFREVAKLTKTIGPDSFGLEGKKLWLTEFGIPSKVVGAYNSERTEHIPLIRPRALPAEALPFKSAVWEDLWDAFFEQVTPEDLAAANCEALAFYTLRETGVPGYDKHDDDRSNCAIIRRNGLPRMDPKTFVGFRNFMNAARGSEAPAATAFEEMPLWARGKSYSISLLRGRPWDSIAVPREALDTISMLTVEEKRFLYWCTSEYYENKGEIVDLGPFAGGSSVALASGLRSSWPSTERTVKVYDRFITDDYIDEFYLKPNGLHAVSGRFRHAYDKQTAAFADMLAVREGDVTHEAWDGSPIEILFVDVAKTWHVNDHVNRTFFPHLIPGKSLVIQQDFFHQWECWTILTMELLNDYFEYVGFVRWNTAVYRCTRAIPLEAIPEDLRALGLERLRSLLDAQLARHADPYLRGMLTTAMIALLRDFGSHLDAQELAGKALRDFSDQPIVIEAVRQFGATR